MVVDKECRRPAVCCKANTEYRQDLYQYSEHDFDMGRARRGTRDEAGPPEKAKVEEGYREASPEIPHRAGRCRRRNYLRRFGDGWCGNTRAGSTPQRRVPTWKVCSHIWTHVRELFAPLLHSSKQPPQLRSCRKHEFRIHLKHQIHCSHHGHSQQHFAWDSTTYPNKRQFVYYLNLGIL